MKSLAVHLLTGDSRMPGSWLAMAAYGHVRSADRYLAWTMRRVLFRFAEVAKWKLHSQVGVRIYCNRQNWQTFVIDN